MSIERRDFLRLAGTVATGAVVAGCAGAQPPAPQAGPARASAPSSDGGPAPVTPSPAATPPATRPVKLGRQVVHGPRNRSRVALTFHGQGPVGMADALLAEAEKAGARVTVLAVGTWLAQYPEMAHRVLRGGHDLGNHTMHHLDIAAMDAAGAYAEIAECARRLHALTGSIGRWFRPSQAHFATPVIERAARTVGYQTCISYDVDSLDYTDPGPDAVVANVLGAARPGSIVSMHLGHPGTVTAMPALLRGLAKQKLTAVTLTGLLYA